MIMALMVLGTTSAFAGDSAPLKSILAAKSYAEAANLLKSNLSQLANAEEKAKAYNKLVDLALQKVADEDNKKVMAGIAISAKDAPSVDDAGLYQALYNAFESAYQCETYDQQPNAKGKVAPKFHKKNQDRLNNRRLDLINAGVFYQEKENKAEQFKFLDMFVESVEQPLFSDAEKGAVEDNIGNIAFYSAYNALLEKQYAKAEHYATYSLNDSVQSENAYVVLMSAMQNQLSTRQDTLDYAKKLEKMYQENPDKPVLFESLCAAYSSLEDTQALKKLIADKLTKDPKDWAALSYRGQMAQNEKRIDDAIKDFTLARESAPDNAFVAAALGICYMDKARQVEQDEQDSNNRISAATEAKRNELLKQAVVNFEDARKLDTNLDYRRNWAYNLYNCYYVLYGENDARTKELESLQ